LFSRDAVAERYLRKRGGKVMVRGAWMAVVCGMLAGAAHAQEAYPIKLKDAGKNETVADWRSEEVQAQLRVLDPAGKVLVDQSQKKSVQLVYQETVLERPEGQMPTSLRRKYDQAQLLLPDAKETLPFENKLVLIEKRDGAYRFRTEGGAALAGKDALFLDNEFNSNKLDSVQMRRILLPTRPVRVNETWNIDPDPLIKDLIEGDGSAVVVDRAKAIARGQLASVYVKDGHRFGKMTFTIELPLTQMRQGNNIVPLRAGARLTAVKTIDACIDGSLVSGTMEAVLQTDAVALLEGGKNGTAIISNKVILKETQREVPRN
jgi:hypothetical protein